MKHDKNTHSCFLPLMLGAVFIINLLLGNPIGNQFTRWKTQLRLDDTVQYYNSVVAKVPLEEEHLLAELPAKLHIPDAYPFCIIGRGYQIYGNNRDYADIIADYTERIVGLGWESAGTSRNYPQLYNYYNRPNNHPRISTMGISIAPISDADIFLQESPKLAELVENNLASWLDQYQTIYVISFEYYDPESGCLLF